MFWWMIENTGGYNYKKRAIGRFPLDPGIGSVLDPQPSLNLELGTLQNEDPPPNPLPRLPPLRTPHQIR